MRLCYIVFFLLLTAYCFPIFAQELEEKPTYQVGIKGGYGFIIDHSPVMQYITNQHIQRQSLYFEKQSFGDKEWHQRFQFPRLGLIINRYQLNNRDHLGEAYALAPYLNFSLVGNKSIQLRLKTALGLGYMEKPFDIKENHKNVAIGSQFNLFFSVAVESEFLLFNNGGITLGVNYDHYSNTGYQKPNLGINLPQLESGIFYRFGEERERKIIEEESFKREKGEWILFGGFGINEVSSNNKKYVASALSLSREKRLNYKSSIALSVDLFYNPAQIEMLRTDSIFIDKGIENLQLGLSFYHLLHFGKFGVITQAGVYFKTENKDLTNFYQIVGGRIQLNNKLSGYFGLKTHFAKAEYLLFGINYRLNE